MTKMQMPSKPCWVCGSNNWWLTSDGRYLCGRCHPNPNPGSALVPHSNEDKYSSEVLALRDRVKAGNDKLTKAWHQILEIADKQEQVQQDERWFEARDKLGNLCLELQAKGYEDCLFLNENGQKMRSCLSSPDNCWCWVCPSKKKYWEEEFEKL